MATVSLSIAERIERLEPAYQQTVIQAVIRAEEQANADFAQRVRDLPAELFIMVKDFTFAIERTKVKIDQSYKPPSILQVDRELRCMLSESFYEEMIFYIDDMNLLCQWTKSLEKQKGFPRYALYKIHEIRFDTKPRLRKPTDDYEAYQQCREYENIIDDLQRENKIPRLFSGVHCNMCFPSDGKEVWTRNPFGTYMRRLEGYGEDYAPPKSP